MAPDSVPPPLAGVVDALVEFASREPVLVGIVVVMLVFVFLGYLFLRRTVASAREGFEDAYRR